ncbi:LLM class flavin-dependent oxidoreductase [Peribacillus saganii]|uniref:LLM class flavin-dependent oxidoreductase n=1 Tax=Peribacillus saganii TaxID=2303992 RepID=A0A372LRE3_9BACI|nr:LLM class flavin-dependent oxidoreductase [Peribacillus saganii]RFU70789.1 LLM class flavin-dependent oxidoreductase [Peribacillus saganii]
MKLSILDQSPIPAGKTAGQALQESMKLAQIGEKLGYERYWIAEHHDLKGLACPSPEVMLGYIGANTEKIRIGSGAVLLPHYKPYKVAESFNLLATLFPGRIDIGIGRAPGGSAEVSMALSDNYLEQVRKMPDSFKELMQFLYNDFPDGHLYSKVAASPLPAAPPEPWILGTSEKSGRLAAENGTAYAFGHFMSEKSGPDIMKNYIQSYQANGRLLSPKSIVAVSVICAETTERAEEIALSAQLWQLQLGKGEGDQGIPSIDAAKQYSYNIDDRNTIDKIKKKMVIGNPHKVKQELAALQREYQADEIMVITITHQFEDRANSYRLLASELIRR